MTNGKYERGKKRRKERRKGRGDGLIYQVETRLALGKELWMWPGGLARLVVVNR